MLGPLKLYGQEAIMQFSKVIIFLGHHAALGPYGRDSDPSSYTENVSLILLHSFSNIVSLIIKSYYEKLY